MPKANPIISNPTHTKQNQSPNITHFTTVTPPAKHPNSTLYASTTTLSSMPLDTDETLLASQHLDQKWRLGEFNHKPVPLVPNNPGQHRPHLELLFREHPEISQTT
jgi:hypothetical protein